MEVHDGVVVALVSVDRGVRVQPDDEVVALDRHPLEEVEVANVKEVDETWQERERCREHLAQAATEARRAGEPSHGHRR